MEGKVRQTGMGTPTMTRMVQADMTWRDERAMVMQEGRRRDIIATVTLEDSRTGEERGTGMSGDAGVSCLDF